MKQFEVKVPLDKCVKSLGPCEVCDKVKPCYDLPKNSYEKKSWRGKG